MANDYVYWLLLIVSWALTICCLIDMHHHRYEFEAWQTLDDEDA